MTAHEKHAPENPAAARRSYVYVWLALLALTFATTTVGKIDLGPFNVYVALTIAVIKALLVMLFFMHVNHSRGITRVYVVAGFFWLGIMLVMTLTDYLTRRWPSPSSGW